MMMKGLRTLLLGFLEWLPLMVVMYFHLREALLLIGLSVTYFAVRHRIARVTREVLAVLALAAFIIYLPLGWWSYIIRLALYLLCAFLYHNRWCIIKCQLGTFLVLFAIALQLLMLLAFIGWLTRVAPPAIN